MQLKSAFQTFLALTITLSIFITGTLSANAYSRTINFSGYEWTVKSGYNGPGPNYWNDSEQAVFTDSEGQLHMKISKIDEQWYSSEVYLPSSLGYGTYEFTLLTNPNQVDANIVLAPFLYQDDEHEIDIEYTNWGYKGADNINYTVQPYTISGNTKFFPSPESYSSSPIVARITWAPEKIYFETLQDEKLLASWEYTGTNNFQPGSEKVHINFWMIKGIAPSDLNEQEAVIRSFSFTPYTATVVAPETDSTIVAPAPEKTKVDRKKKKTKHKKKHYIKHYKKFYNTK